jgi:negative regulator of flagellin synthesis FlgM
VKVNSTNSNGTRSLQNGVSRTQQQPQSENASAAGANSSAAASTAAGGDSNVSLSSLSSSLRSLAVSGSADIDMDQVNAIKDALRNGTLQMDTGKIADGVIETARNLLKPSSSSGN